MTVTMKDVAKAANVSVATVSNVMSNGPKYVSPEVRAAVEKAIKELGYRPSRIARSLRTRRTFYIGLTVPDITNPFFAEIAAGVEKQALDAGYQLFLVNTDGDPDRESRAVLGFQDHLTDGIINIAPRMPDEQMASIIGDTPTVIVDRPCTLKGDKLGIVYTDNIIGSSQVAQHLLHKGHIQFACIAGPPEVPNVRSRIEGFMGELKRAGVAIEAIPVVYGDFKFDSGFSHMQELLTRVPRPTAVFVCNDLMAWGALEAAKEKGMRIPEDVAISGFDDVYFASLVNPALTTVRQPRRAVGEIAMEVMLDLINGDRDSPSEIREVLQSELVVRQST